jgi:peptidoglycan-associated lipoprotein
MREHPGIKIRVEGHCDERGTVEYNQALGERRAQAVRNYLVSAGVTAANIESISFGKEQPLCDEHNEGCWQKNRCAHVAMLTTLAAN